MDYHQAITPHLTVQPHKEIAIMKSGDGIKPFSQYKDIFDFYEKTGMTPQEAHEYLLNELKRSGVDADKTGK